MAASRLMVGVVLAATLLVTAPGYASLPPARAVTAIGLIAGRWQGRIAFTGRSYELFYLTINRDGSLVASWDGVTRYGKVTLERGRARFSLYVWNGNVDYLEGGGERVILMKEDLTRSLGRVTSGAMAAVLLAGNRYLCIVVDGTALPSRSSASCFGSKAARTRARGGLGYCWWES